MLSRDFYKRDAEIVAKELLGKYIIREYENVKLVAKIVETECYKAVGDKGAHMNNNKITNRTKIAFEEGGHIYIYLIYGMHYCFNIVSGDVGEGGAVLIRAIEPIDGIDKMILNRYNEMKSDKKSVKNIGNGPGKLCKAMAIDKSFYGKDLCKDVDIYLTKGEYIDESDIVFSKRVNIDYAEEAKDFLWRYYIRGNEYVSRK